MTTSGRGLFTAVYIIYAFLVQAAAQSLQNRCRKCIRVRNNVRTLCMGMGCSRVVLLATILTVQTAGDGLQLTTAIRDSNHTSHSSQSEMSGGSVTHPVYDEQHRPITAGGFVTSGPRIFQDVAKQSGLTKWSHTLGSESKQFIVDTDGSGVALLDYDNDGWLDIYLVNGSNMDGEAGRAAVPHAALFHNNHDGTFTDVAVAARVTNDSWGYGVAIGDFDNDGWPDIYVTNLGTNRLYRNNHDGTFTDVAAKAGVQVGNWSTGATFGDFDGDGRLDLFVAGYVQFDLDHPPERGTATTSYHTCEYRGVPVSCGPRGLPGAADHLFHNNGDGTFREVSRQAGVDDPQHFYGFAAVFANVTDSGRPDLLVANDSTPNFLYVNQGNGSFMERGAASGFAYNKEGREVASMGLAVGDYLNNGRLDLAITDFADDSKLLLRNDGDGNFTEVSDESGLGESTYPFLGWGVGFLDYDNDGWKDLMMVNGHIYPAVDNMHWGTSYAQRPLLFHNRHGLRFELVPALQGSGLARVTSARGAAFGDLFNDGKIDVVVNNLEGPPLLLRNVTTNAHCWIEVKLIGGPKSPHDGVGATLYLEAQGLKQREDILSGGSFLSSNDQRAHFGLGNLRKIDDLTIRWPSGKLERVVVPRVNCIFTVAEGQGIVDIVPGVGTRPAVRKTPMPGRH